MARSHSYDDLDEMLVPQDHSEKAQDEVKVTDKPKAPKKGASDKTPYQLQKDAAKRKERRRIALIAVVCFAAVLAVLIGIGLVMSERAGTMGGNGTSMIEKAQPAEGMTFFQSDIEPELSAEGVKGRLKEVYYTVDGDLAVTLRLSNGTSSEHKLVKVGIRIFNAADETVAQQTIDRFDPVCKVPAGGYNDVYFVIDKSYVAITNDPLRELGTTLEIGSTPTDGSGEQEDSGNGDGPKDIAEGRTYYENTGNIPALSAEGVKASVIRARYTNDGSLAVTLSLSNGTDAEQQVGMVDLLIQNGDGTTIADYTFDTFETPCTVASQSYTELELIVDAAYVPLQDDPLSTLSCTVSVSAGPIA